MTDSEVGTKANAISNKSESSNSKLKVLFLSSDTGGGHRASAESLARQFELLYPGTTYDLLDVMAKDGVPPYNNLVEAYKHLSAHPTQWKVVYSISNYRASEFFFDVHNKLMCEKAIRKSIMEYDPDVVVSVHPMMTNVPIASCANINKETGKYLPIFTVVTDLGSAHCLWFANGVDKMYIASDQIRALAKARGKVPDEKLVQIGLPIRHQFAVQANAMGDRLSTSGIKYQQKVRSDLHLPFVDRKTLLVMGGGEGVGSLSNIVDSLYVELVNRGVDAVILVVCGRNEKLKKSLEEKDWDHVLKIQTMLKENGNRALSEFSFSSCVGSSSRIIESSSSGELSGCIEGSVAQKIRKILSTSSLSKYNAVDSAPKTTLSSYLEPNSSVDVEQQHERMKKEVTNFAEMEANIGSLAIENIPPSQQDIREVKESTQSTRKNVASFKQEEIQARSPGKVSVVGLGFVTKMAEYMVASDILISKAGPGTIAEAAALSLPVMLTSFLPGQEEGNVDFVVNGGFGSFISDSDPSGVAEEVANWLSDDNKLSHLSKAAKTHGAPNAARDIVKSIGDLSLRWKKINEDRRRLEKEAEILRNGTCVSDDNDIQIEEKSSDSSLEQGST